MALLGITIRPSTKTITGHSLHSGMSVQQSIALPRLGRDTASIASILSRISREYKVVGWPSITGNHMFMSPECYICYRLYEIIWVCLGVSSGNVVLAILIGKYRETIVLKLLKRFPSLKNILHEGMKDVQSFLWLTAFQQRLETQSRHPSQLEGTNGLSEVKYPQRAEYSSAGSCSDFFQLLSG